jgi:hypothetical protein
MRVQCISNKCGFYPDLKIGHWYEDVSPAGKYVTITFGGHGYSHYERSLFRTELERRDTRLDKILKQDE